MTAVTPYKNKKMFGLNQKVAPGSAKVINMLRRNFLGSYKRQNNN